MSDKSKTKTVASKKEIQQWTVEQTAQITFETDGNITVNEKGK